MHALVLFILSQLYLGKLLGLVGKIFLEQLLIYLFLKESHLTSFLMLMKKGQKIESKKKSR